MSKETQMVCEQAKVKLVNELANSFEIDEIVKEMRALGYYIDAKEVENILGRKS